ncbi:MULTISPECIES: esterase/lipase family protein [Delftia]|uniref:Esterase/lipase family protein n=1 Tax=Delftia deserti TaxID=1651218 RepID=A0ABW5ETW8_9BURK|nr:alpha/beta fold hydrolase [Delftia sp. UME58]MBB1652932.1 hypothetical protein [Delftia sp. UME58]MBL8355335.1 alpha/beta fold hydrolase [Delftia acidovorans]
MNRVPPTVARCAMMLLVLACAGCAGVKVSSVSTQDYIAQRRGDVLTTGEPSAAASDTLAVLGLDVKGCRTATPSCISALRNGGGLDSERRLATLSEIWLLHALALQGRGPMDAHGRDMLLDAYLQSSRYAYAYLFFSPRSPGERSFEERQTQVRDYYNYAVQQAVTGLFERDRTAQAQADDGTPLQVGDWRIVPVIDGMRLPAGTPLPQELIPASTLTFRGLRSMYRRDGFGAELVAVMARRAIDGESPGKPYSEAPFPALTAILTFHGASLEQVLATHEARLTVYDPYRRDRINLGGASVPLAANFTSGYGLWLARSGFATQAIRNVLGRGDALAHPRIYLLQPYDPDRRIVVMLHGLASSPEAWINLANEVLGDEILRRGYQIWQVYYPTNAPMAYNHAEIRKALQDTLAHFDPQGRARASRDMVVIGHSMGGVLSRLMVSSSGDVLWNALQEKHDLSVRQIEQVQQQAGDMLSFEPFAGIGRAVFIAAPHRGTPFAENRLSRWLSNLITLPATVLHKFSRLHLTPRGSDRQDSGPFYIPNGVDNLSQNDPFIQLSAGMAISPQVPYHSIVANDRTDVPLQDSDDGLVPYRSAHLPGAASELVIPFKHSVQEAPQAIVEIRRILRLHLQSP